MTKTSSPSVDGTAAKVLDRLGRRLGKDRVQTGYGARWTYGYDNSRRQGLADGVVFAAAESEVQRVLAEANAAGVPVIARGRGTGTTGATVPVSGGIVLSLERMNRIRAVDPANRLIVAEPGVTNGEVQAAAGAHGFFWPPDPTSGGYSTLGGNLAYNAAGPRAVKYGTPRDNTLGLRAVSADGRAFTTGVKTTKGVVGYDLTRLLIGSEGTLAVITEATLRLTPQPEAKRTLRAIYRDVESAAEAVVRLMGQPVTPCALEFMDHRAIEMIRDYPEAAALPTDAGALLMIEVDGPAAYLEAAEAAVREAAGGHGLLRVESASDPAEVKALWATRKALSPALRHVAPKKINEDVAVPVANIPALVRALEGLATRYGITIVNFGHAGNGNLHVNLLIDPEDPRQAEAAQGCLSEVFDEVLALEGTLSGEHGVGLEKRDYVDRELDPVALEMMHRLKATFDPRGILNPGKGLPDPHPAPSPS